MTKLAAFVTLAWLAGCAGAAPSRAPETLPPAAPAAAPETYAAPAPSGETAGRAPGAPPTATVEMPPPVPEPAPSGPTETSLVAAMNGSGWMQFHGDAARGGASKAAPIAHPRIRWKAKVGSQSWLNSPLVLAEMVAVPSCGKAHNQPDAGDGVYAFDLASGHRVWFSHLDDDANGVAATSKRIFVTSDDGKVYALDARTGKKLWHAAGLGKMYTHPLLAGDAVVTGDAHGYLRAFRQSDGSALWKVQLTGAIRGGAAADAKHIYAVSQGGEAIALSYSGHELWQKTIRRASWDGHGPAVPIEGYAAPIVDGNLLIVPFARDTYYKDVPAIVALDIRTGRVRWRARGAGDWGNIRSTPALSDGTLVYAEPYSGDIVGIAASTGRMLHRHTVGPCFFPQYASPAAARDVVYVPRFGGSLYAVKARTGQLVWKIYLGDSRIAGGAPPAALQGNGSCEWDVPTGHALYSPVAIADDGTLLVGSSEGFLYAIGER
jgi:outer membrane protein assembly factor BamB